MTVIYELAQNLEEAKDLCQRGFGYKTRRAAERAKKQALADGADPYYINLLKVYKVGIQWRTRQRSATVP